MKSSSHGKKRVLIVGAGLSGLASAYYLVKSGFEVEVLEMLLGPGGLIGTARVEHGIAETGANGVLNSRLVENLFDDVGCTMIGTKRESRARYVFRDGRPRTLFSSLSFADLATLAAFAIKTKTVREAVIPEPTESLRAWASRALSPSIGRYLVEAAAQGIYAGDPERLSASLCCDFLFAGRDKSAWIFGEATAEQLAEMEPQARKEAEAKIRKDRRRRLKFKGTVSAEGGMGQLIEKLEAYLKENGVRIRYGARALPTKQDADKRPIVIATSLPQARELVEGVDPERARAMAAVPMLPLISVTAFYRGPSPKQGFGMLFPPVEKRRALGVLFNSSIFEGRAPVQGTETSSETWMFGGARADQELLEASDEKILEWVDEERAISFGSRGERLEAVITRWPEALPHYTRELEKRLPHFRENRENIFLIGNYLGQIGLAKILEKASRLPQEISASGRWS